MLSSKIYTSCHIWVSSQSSTRNCNSWSA